MSKIRKLSFEKSLMNQDHLTHGLSASTYFSKESKVKCSQLSVNLCLDCTIYN